MFKPGSIVTVTDSSWSAIVNKQTGAITRPELHGQIFKLLGVLNVSLPTTSQVSTPDHANNAMLVNKDNQVIFTHSKFLEISNEEWEN